MSPVRNEADTHFHYESDECDNLFGIVRQKITNLLIIGFIYQKETYANYYKFGYNKQQDISDKKEPQFGFIIKLPIMCLGVSVCCRIRLAMAWLARGSTTVRLQLWNRWLK